MRKLVQIVSLSTSYKIKTSILYVECMFFMIYMFFYVECVQGVLASGVMFTLVAWCIRMRGPLFVSVFNPLMLVLVAIAGSLVLNEHLHLGRYLHSNKTRNSNE